MPVQSPCSERAAFGELHAEEGQAVVIADLVDRQDARMIELRDRLRLVPEPLQHARHVQQLRQQHFHGDEAAGRQLARPVHDAHAAAGDLVEQLAVADPPAPDAQPFLERSGISAAARQGFPLQVRFRGFLRREPHQAGGAQPPDGARQRCAAGGTARFCCGCDTH
jgi:hypothetical protein